MKKTPEDQESPPHGVGGTVETPKDNRRKLMEAAAKLAAEGVDWVRRLDAPSKEPVDWIPPQGPDQSGWPKDLAEAPGWVRRAQNENRERLLADKGPVNTGTVRKGGRTKVIPGGNGESTATG